MGDENREEAEMGAWGLEGLADATSPFARKYWRGIIGFAEFHGTRGEKREKNDVNVKRSLNTGFVSLSHDEVTQETSLL